MEKYFSIRIEYNLAKDYFIATLIDGQAFAREILKSIDFAQGEFFALLAEGADESKLEDFRFGGVLDLPPKEKKSIHGSFYMVRKKRDSKQVLSKFLQENLRNHPGNFCLFEEISFQKGDPYLSKNREMVRYYMDEVYYVFDPTSSDSKALDSLIQVTHSDWYFMMAVTSVGRDIEITPNDLQQMAKDVSLVVIGAYDGEGYLYWEK